MSILGKLIAAPIRVVALPFRMMENTFDALGGESGAPREDERIFSGIFNDLGDVAEKVGDNLLK